MENNAQEKEEAPTRQSKQAGTPLWKAMLFIIYGVLIGLLAAGLVWLLDSPPRGTAVEILPTSTPGPLVVYVSGAVASPGVYTLPAGSRVEDAIEAAGGLAPGAEGDRINLAEPVNDGEQVDVPGIVQLSHVSAGRVNINTASVDELDALPGIGLSAAEAIVAYRLENGSFTRIQDIQNVPGIGPATFEKIQDYITVGD